MKHTGKTNMCSRSVCFYRLFVVCVSYSGRYIMLCVKHLRHGDTSRATIEFNDVDISTVTCRMQLTQRGHHWSLKVLCTRSREYKAAFFCLGNPSRSDRMMGTRIKIKEACQ